MTSSIIKKFLFALSVVFLASCDSDYNDLGSDITEGDIHHNGIERRNINVVAFDRLLGPVQSNNLPVNSLGVFNDPVFGRTTAHFVTQAELAQQNPRLNDPIVDSVYLYVPYFSTRTGTQADGTGSYVLDSIFGNRDATIRLSVFKNNYFLRTTDPATTLPQRYFSDEKQLVENEITGGRLNNSANLAENDQFSFNSSEIITYQPIENDDESAPIEYEVKERLAPGIYVKLDAATMDAAIFGDVTKLTNNNLFREYFRGLYFKAEANGADGAMAMLQFAQARIMVDYNDNVLRLDGTFDTANRESKTLTVNLRGNSINFFDTTYTSAFEMAANGNVDDITGNSRLYVKGGPGSMAVINLDTIALNNLKPGNNNGENILINEANLIFYVDEAVMANNSGPLRLYLYDLKNRRPLIDYSLDNSTSSLGARYDKSVFDGIKASNGSQRRYRLRLTDHINNIINKDSVHRPLGLVITDNINLVSNVALESPFTTGVTEVKNVTTSSVINPRGTVLHGSNAAVPEDKRLKLQIYFTKPN